MNTVKTEYIFLWYIENYSHCWHKNGEKLISPEFTADSLEGTNWSVHLYPRGQIDEYKEFISLYLHRSTYDTGLKNVSIKYELAVLAADGSRLHWDEHEYTFNKGLGYGTHMFLKRDELLLRRKAEYLPQDTLRMQCKIWKEEEVQPQTQICARTRIGIERISFLHVTEGFSSLKLNHRETELIKFPSKKGDTLLCSLCLPNDFSGEEKIIMEITPSDSSKYSLSVCKLSLLDRSGKKIECCEIDNRLDAIKNEIPKLPLSLTMRVILNQKNGFLSDDKLSVLCECIFSSGVEYEKIENTVYEKLFMGLITASNNKTDDIYAEQLSACPSALHDLKAIFNNQFLTDVEVKTKSFLAHKNVLCARSSVFKTMMTNDMKERHTDCIQIDDLEDDVVQQLLFFLYSDELENLEWESAIKLYYAGDKYTIEKLKLLCSSFLVKNLSTSNVIEVLLLADTHSDSFLKKAVEDFILNHDEQVFSSDEWRSLIKTNSVLVSETMCLKYLRK